MGYLTLANFYRMISKLDINMILSSIHVDLNESIVEEIPNTVLRFLNKRERGQLLFIKHLNQIDDDVIESAISIDNIHIDNKDTLATINKGFICYHENKNCELMNKDFQAICIPPSIKKQGKQKCDEFRMWFQRHNYLHYSEIFSEYNYLIKKNDDIETIPLFAQLSKDMQKEFQISPDEAKLVIVTKQKAVITSNYEDPTAIIDNIERTLKEWNFWFKIDDVYLRQFKKDCFNKAHQGMSLYKWKSDKNIDNDTRLCLKYMDETFKTPIIDCLKKYLLAKINFESHYFNNRLLELMNIKPCKKCCHPFAYLFEYDNFMSPSLGNRYIYYNIDIDMFLSKVQIKSVGITKSQGKEIVITLFQDEDGNIPLYQIPLYLKTYEKFNFFTLLKQKFTSYNWRDNEFITVQEFCKICNQQQIYIKVGRNRDGKYKFAMYGSY